jgi:hypothetical protein
MWTLRVIIFDRITLTGDASVNHHLQRRPVGAALMHGRRSAIQAIGNLEERRHCLQLPLRSSSQRGRQAIGWNRFQLLEPEPSGLRDAMEGPNQI